ncbi:hypothetical protein RHSIM_Rhsim01G0182400 [Rhododendron simsii]|uniref:Uncharacterized protein n=1 Tax=Rhododendron simsii TaxID=118357 RepID=A0A834HIF4_RHOSS|nr:hypothetical protein RHSIM_Rhsim01G0182400 [Rhododendron simsii]
MLLPLRISTGLGASSSSSSSLSLNSLSSRTPATTVRFPHCKSLRTNQDIAPVEYRESNSQLTPKNDNGGFGETEEDPAEPGVPAAAAGGGGEAGGVKGISGIQVPRQRYIAISKTELLDGILLMFESQEEIDQFLLLSSCLDSILHAEHKSILEEMRLDYNLTQSGEKKRTSVNGSARSERDDEPKGNEFESSIENTGGTGSMEEYREDKIEPDMLGASSFSLNLRYLLGYLPRSIKRNSLKESRIAVATRFQRAFVQLLCNAQFEELSARDLMLTSALNSDYLLTLPVYVDWKRASESNAIIFRRGYATERQKGLLLVDKLDYLQSKLLQGIFLIISKPLAKVGTWITEVILSKSSYVFVKFDMFSSAALDQAFKSAYEGQDVQIWSERAKLWLKKLTVLQQTNPFSEQSSDNLLQSDQLSDNELPIWLAAQRAVTRYEGILSPIGPRGRLLRKFLIWSGLISPMPRESFDLESDVTTSEPYLRPTFLSRITLSDLWEPASRKHFGNDIWKRLKTAISILFSQSILQEPAFQELILLFTEERVEGETEDTAEVPLLQLKIYERIPIPDLPVIFPHKKLSFRILDTVRSERNAMVELQGHEKAMGKVRTKKELRGVHVSPSEAMVRLWSWLTIAKVRLDVATSLGLLAYFINYKFVNILSSPSAVLLDVIGISALIIYVTRVALGYKQTRDRYQLLVNKTLYEKTLASGFGSVHFLLDASEQQQYKEAILAYAILLKVETGQATCPENVKDKCERFMYDMFEEQVEMPVDKAVDTLVRLGLVTTKIDDDKVRLQSMPCPKAYDVLKQRWNTLLS